MTDKYEALISKLKEVVEKYYDQEFDYDVEHWDWGNTDDSYSYGRECGMNDVAELIHRIVKASEGGGIEYVTI